MAGEIEVGRAAVRLILDDSSFWKDVARLSSATVKDIKIQADADTAKARAELKSLQDETNQTSRDNDTLSRSFGAITGGLGELASGLRNISTLIKAARIPFLLAGLGAIPAIASSAAVAVGQLALGLSQGLVGGLAVVGTAMVGAVAGIRGYIAMAGQLSKEAFEVRGALDGMGLTAEQVHAKYPGYIWLLFKYTERVQDLQAQFEGLKRLVGPDMLRTFNMALGAASRHFDIIEGAVVHLTEAINDQIRSFVHLATRERSLIQIGHTLHFVAFAGGQAAKIAKNLFFVFLSGIQPVIPLSSRLLKMLAGLSTQMRRFAESARGQRQIASFFQDAWRRAQQLWRIVVNLGKGFRNLFSIIAPGTNNMMKSLENLSRSFSQVGARGTESRRKIQQFVNQSKPILKALGNLVGTLVREFFKLAGNVAKMEQGKKHVNTLAKAINGLAKAIPPVRRLLQQTFKDLGPTIGPLAKQVARFFKEFAGSTDVLTRTVRLMTQLLRQFNKLPGPVKHLVAELVAFRIVSRILGFSILVKLAGSLGKAGIALLGFGRDAKKAQGTNAILRGSFLRLAATIVTRFGPGGAVYVFGKLAKHVLENSKTMERIIEGFADRMRNTGAFGLIKVFQHLPAALKQAFVTGAKNIPIFGPIIAQATRDGMDVAKTWSKSGQQAGTNAREGFKKGVNTGDNGIKQFTDKTKRDTMNHFGIRSPSSVFAGFGKMNVQGLANGMNNNVGIANSAGQNVANKVKAPIQAIKLFSVGQSIIQGLLNGITDRIPGLKDIIDKLAKDMPDWVKTALGISSPSKVFESLGKNVSEGFAQGILRNAHLTENATRQMALRAHRGAVVSMPQAGMGASVRHGDVYASFPTTINQGASLTQAEAMVHEQVRRHFQSLRRGGTDARLWGGAV